MVKYLYILLSLSIILSILPAVSADETSIGLWIGDERDNGAYAVFFLDQDNYVIVWSTLHSSSVNYPVITVFNSSGSILWGKKIVPSLTDLAELEIGDVELYGDTLYLLLDMKDSSGARYAYTARFNITSKAIDWIRKTGTAYQYAIAYTGDYIVSFYPTPAASPTTYGFIYIIRVSSDGGSGYYWKYQIGEGVTISTRESAYHNGYVYTTGCYGAGYRKILLNEDDTLYRGIVYKYI